MDHVYDSLHRQNTARLHDLEERFKYQFPQGYRVVCMSIPPGWMAIVESLCVNVDEVLDDDAKDRFRWTSICSEYGRLYAMCTDVDAVECPELRELCERVGVASPWKPFDHHIEAVITAAAKAASRTCEACGQTCDPAPDREDVRCRDHIGADVPFVV